jgi:UDP-N-acetylglucosamine pyrophosphorylase
MLQQGCHACEQVYVESILAFQARGPAGCKLPLAIMTSGDTHARTQKLLEDNAYFGMDADQIILIKQEKVGQPLLSPPRSVISKLEHVIDLHAVCDM